MRGQLALERLEAEVSSMGLTDSSCSLSEILLSLLHKGIVGLCADIFIYLLIIVPLLHIANNFLLFKPSMYQLVQSVLLLLIQVVRIIILHHSLVIVKFYLLLIIHNRLKHRLIGLKRRHLLLLKIIVTLILNIISLSESLLRHILLLHVLLETLRLLLILLLPLLCSSINTAEHILIIETLIRLILILKLLLLLLLWNFSTSSSSAETISPEVVIRRIM